MKPKFQILTTLFTLFSMLSGMSLTAQPVLAAEGTLQAIGGMTWEDLDHDGIREPGSGEAPKSGMTVNLFACDGSTILQTAVTNAIGGYMFFVEPGSYKVQFVEPSGFIFTLKDQGSDETKDSDADPASGFSECVTVAAGGINKFVDAGFFKEVVVEKAAIGDFVWLDLDADGVQDSNETGVEGITVRLLDCAGNVLATATTNASGFYLFSNLMPGNYNIQFVLPGGFFFSPQNVGDDAFDSDANGSGFTACTTLAPGETDLTWDAGIFQKAAIGDRVWFDTNRNGMQDEGEDGVEGVTVRLLDCAGNLLATATTNASGLYLFSNLMPGNYNIQFVLPSGYVFTVQNIGDDASDSDANASGFTACTTLVSGEIDRTWDAGLVMRQEGPGTGTPGYWKNHPEAWPVEMITIGGVSYTKAQAIWWMDQPDGDKTITLFRALVAAKLNVLIGNDASCIASTINAADAWFVTYGPVGSGVPAKSAAWRLGEPLYELLDLYNNGGLCAPHRG